MKPSDEYLDNQLKQHMINLLKVTTGILSIATFHYIGIIIYQIVKLF